MSSSENQFNKRRARSSYITSVISISMVLFMLGLLGLLLVNAKKLSDSARESFQASVYFRDTVSDVQILEMQANLEKNPAVRSTTFITKTQAAEKWKEEWGEDFLDFLEFNPLPASLEVNFKPEFARPEDFEKFEQEWMGNTSVEKVKYPMNLIRTVIGNLRKLGLFLLAFSVVLLVIAIALINNTIRLSIYSRRFLIKTMQLVGATRGFIRRPFLKAGFFQGFAGGLLAVVLLSLLVLFGEQQLPELKEMRDIRLLSILAGGLVAGGVILSWICTFFAVRKYLNLKTDSLY